MKYLLLSLFVCAVISTGLSQPVVNEVSSIGDNERVVIYEEFQSDKSLIQIAEEEEDDEKTTLEKLREKLNELVERLRKQGKTRRAAIVEKYIRVLERLMKKLEDGELDKTKFYEFVKRVKALLEKYNKEHPKEDELVQIFEDDENNDKEDEKTTLEKLREKLNELVERLRKQGKTRRAAIVEKYIRVLERLMKKLEDGELDKTKFYEFVKRVKALLEKYNKEHPKEDELVQIFADDDDLPNDDDDNNDDDLPDEDEEKENKSKLEELREKLRELAEKLRKRGKFARARIVEHYIDVLERLLKRLENHELDKTRFADFIKRVKALLEKYLEKESN